MKATVTISEREIQIDMPLKLSANLIYAGRHWTKRNAEAEVYHMLILHQVRKHNIIFPEPTSLHFLFQFKGKMLDCSNCFYMAKMCEDGLVKAGALKDDTPKYVNKIILEVIKGDSDKIILDVSAI